MHLTKDSPLKELREMEREMERLLRDFFIFKSPLMVSENSWSPHIDVFETKTEYVVRVDIAGVNKEEIRVTMSGNILKISGRRIDTWPGERIHYYQMEINYGYFEREIELPNSVDGKQVKATYERGFLEIVLPKVDVVPPESVYIEIED